MKEGILPHMHNETKKELCEGCPWGKEIDPLVNWLYGKLLMQDAGCQLERHELSTEEWKLLLDFRRERDNWIKENTPKDGKHNSGDTKVNG